MKSVLASLKPYYYYLVGEGIKKIEVRKSQPKADDWNKETYFYMSKDEKSFAMIPKEFQEKYRKHFGKVGLKFVCDRIEPFDVPYPAWSREYLNPILNGACLTYSDLHSYIGSGNRGYAWHISDLVIYDKPKELSEFIRPCDRFLDCITCKRLVRNVYLSCENTLIRPPMSWCYVEDEE